MQTAFPGSGSRNARVVAFYLGLAKSGGKNITTSDVKTQRRNVETGRKQRVKGAK
jgi:hypothetical protein